jgi:hypothetical protein
VATLTEWVEIDSLISHNALAELQGGDSVEEEYFHITEDMFNALEQADSPSETNPILTQSDLSLVPVKHSFVFYNGIPQNTSTEMFTVGSVAKHIVLPKAGFLTDIVVTSSHDRNAGQCIFTPILAGSDVSALSVNLDGLAENNNYKTVEQGTMGVSHGAGTFLTVKMEADSDWETNDPEKLESIQVDVYGCFGVELGT